jgi:oligopeptide/dipeptide ABC transporter ATP-binding protein
MENVLLEVKHLKKYFKAKQGTLHAVDDVSFQVMKGETLGLVGESGCGKSTTGRAILRLHEPTSGEVLYKGKDIVKYDKKQMKEMRKKMQIVFQDPYSCLNPRLSVFDLIADPLYVNKDVVSKSQLNKHILHTMELVGLEKRLINSFPHELDGGRRQRVGIARALALNPEFIVLDEPVSALDVSIQSQILNLLDELQEKLGLTYIFVAHNLSVVKHISDRIAVMYLGNIVELTDYKSIFADPLHPYTQALLSAIPIPKVGLKRERIVLEGDVPSPINPGPGCVFYGRCRNRKDICKEAKPNFEEKKPGHFVACHLV